MGEEAFFEVGLLSVKSQAVNAGNNCFSSNFDLTEINFPSLATSGIYCFADNPLISNFNFPSLISVGDMCFNNCQSGTYFNFPSVDNFGQVTVNTGVFSGITGNTISLTTKKIHKTSNGGNLEGDLDYLDANNTVTFSWL